MNQKQIGAIIGTVGILILVFVFVVKYSEDRKIDQYVMSEGTCYLNDGTCLHEQQDNTLYLFGWMLGVALILLAGYLVFFDRTQQTLAEQHKSISDALREAKRRDEFSSFLKAFTHDEQKILMVLKENDGITQSTLRFKTGLSKANLSNLVRSLEEMEFIKRVPKGKTYQVYLKHTA